MIPAQSKRIVSIDILRGIVMVIMALDHTRDYFTNFTHNPTDLEYASTAMFLTRWITHFCAPIFVFLSGTSAFLSMQKGKTTRQQAGFLLSRGIWLIILEFTIVRFGWVFNVDYTQVFVQVIWAIGWSMIFLSGLIFLPRKLILAIALGIIFLHNVFDGVHAANLGNYGPWWNVFHEFGNIHLFGDVNMFVLYPLVPWIAVMAAGYCFGGIMQREEGQRDKWLYRIGLSAIALFIVLRFTNIYGDSALWSNQGSWHRTVLSFINVTKYPPSLLYLLMTIGPAIALLPILEKMRNRVGNFFTVYGRVPMFYYILHIYLIHLLSMMIGVWVYDVPSHYFTGNGEALGTKPNWGYSLVGVYLYWMLIIALLYLPCRWFMQVKMTHKKWWLSYL